tara:strand:+ start:362 stop:793 length:432 start_codon:yes stop_codon:yes gene_type:complete
MARAKSKKWAAESLVSETEKKAIASPEEQKMAGELTAEILLMMSPISGGKKAFNLAKKAFKGKGKSTAKKTADKVVKKIKKIAGKYVDPSDDIDFIKSRLAIGVPTAGAGVVAKKRNEKNKKKAKDGSVKKYAKGGGVRKVRF